MKEIDAPPDMVTLLQDSLMKKIALKERKKEKKSIPREQPHLVLLLFGFLQC